MARTVLLTLFLTVTAVIGYLFYRAVELVPDPSPTEVVTTAATPVDSLPEFSLSDLAGQPTPISSWPGKALLINFWATWCAPCLREIPLLKQFQDDHAQDGIQVVGIAVDRVDPVRAFAMDMAFNYPVLVGEADAIDAAASFGVDFFGLPFSVFTDGESRMLGVHTGELHAEDLQNLSSAITDLQSGAIDLSQARARIAGLR